MYSLKHLEKILFKCSSVFHHTNYFNDLFIAEEVQSREILTLGFQVFDKALHEELKLLQHILDFIFDAFSFAKQFVCFTILFRPCDFHSVRLIDFIENVV